MTCIYSGDRTEQTKEGRKKRQMEEDVFEASESSDSDLEISEGLHRDFEKSSQWGKSLQMLKKMGWKEGEGLGRKQKGLVQISFIAVLSVKVCLAYAQFQTLNPTKAF